MEQVSVFQEISMLLYVIAALLVIVAVQLGRIWHHVSKPTRDERAAKTAAYAARQKGQWGERKVV